MGSLGAKLLIAFCITSTVAAGAEGPALGPGPDAPVVLDIPSMGPGWRAFLMSGFDAAPWIEVAARGGSDGDVALRIEMHAPDGAPWRGLDLQTVDLAPRVHILTPVSGMDVVAPMDLGDAIVRGGAIGPCSGLSHASISSAPEGGRVYRASLHVPPACQRDDAILLAYAVGPGVESWSFRARGDAPPSLHAETWGLGGTFEPLSGFGGAAAELGVGSIAAAGGDARLDLDPADGWAGAFGPSATLAPGDAMRMEHADGTDACPCLTLWRPGSAGPRAFVLEGAAVATLGAVRVVGVDARLPG